MRCPYLSSTSKKECVRMLEEHLDEELSEFDLKHFCDGNPIYCYYFRLPALQTANRVPTIETTLETVPREIPQLKALIKDASLKTEETRWEE